MIKRTAFFLFAGQLGGGFFNISNVSKLMFWDIERRDKTQKALFYPKIL